MIATSFEELTHHRPAIVAELCQVQESEPEEASLLTGLLCLASLESWESVPFVQTEPHFGLMY